MGKFQGHKHHDQECYDENCGKPAAGAAGSFDGQVAARVAAREAVNHPQHYGGAANPYEVVKVLDAWGLDKDFYLGNTIKYLARAGKKDPTKLIEDLEKARWYLDRRIELLKKGS